MVARVRSELGIETSLRSLFESPTVALMAAGLETTAALDENSPGQRIDPAERNGYAPLSFTQQQFWLLDQAEPDAGYNICTALKINGQLEVHRLEQALNTIVERHEVLRTVLGQHDGKPYQRILDKDTWRMHTMEWASVGEEPLTALVERLLEALEGPVTLIRPFRSPERFC